MTSSSPTRRKDPRISVNELAHFMVATDTARMGIIQRAVEPKPYITTRYQDTRIPICAYLSDPHHHVNPLVSAEQMFVQRANDPSEKPLRREDAKLSIEVLRSIQRMRNEFAQYTFTSAPARQSSLNISGVEISVHADLLVYGVGRDSDRIGAAILRMTKDDAITPTAKDKRKRMGIYVTTLASMHTERNITSKRKTLNKLCLSIDIQHGQIFAAPQRNTRRVNDITNACRIIAALWDQF